MTSPKPASSGASDRPPIHGRAWLPEARTRAVVVIVHGFTEHSGRYEHVAQALNERGVAVHAADLRGHGRSGGQRAWIESFAEYLDDAERYVASVRRQNPNTPLFLLGHSMGGTIIAILAIERRVNAQGLIFSAAALRVGANLFPLLRRVASVFSRIWPRLRVARMGCSRLSRDPANIQRFRDDPLVFHGRFPVRTGSEILAAGERVWREAGAIGLPMLILQGSGDRTVDPAGSQHLYNQAASRDKTLKLYDGLYHDLFGEPEKEQVIGDLVDWIVARC